MVEWQEAGVLCPAGDGTVGGKWQGPWLVVDCLIRDL
jgi:hypothetical protein